VLIARDFTTTTPICGDKHEGKFTDLKLIRTHRIGRFLCFVFMAELELVQKRHFKHLKAQTRYVTTTMMMVMMIITMVMSMG
jgi:hypothetical protein